jgi:hypothetical protein
MPAPATPIATYTERLLQVRRELELFDDRIEIRAFWLLGRRFQTTVKLANLTARTTEIFIRNRWAKHAILVGSLAIAAAVVFGREGQGLWAHRASIVAWVATGVCGAVVALTIRKVRFVRFLRPDGKPGLDVAQAGPDSGRFEDFIAQVRRQIRQA